MNIQHFPVVCSTLLFWKGGSGERKVREQGFPRLGSFHGRGTRPDELRQVEHLFKTAGSDAKLCLCFPTVCGCALVGSPDGLAQPCSGWNRAEDTWRVRSTKQAHQDSGARLYFTIAGKCCIQQCNNPDRAEQWYWEKILSDLERDRGV
jgi:hypothetical protein